MQALTYESYRTEWIADIIEGNPSSVLVGNRFSKKLISQWLELDEYNDDIIFCDGSGDGGIDIAYLHRGDLNDNGESEGDTWYIIQSKYGSAFNSNTTLLAESEKVLETISGFRSKLSSISSELVDRIRNFILKSSNNDKLVLVFATVDPLNDVEKRILKDIKTLGESRIGNLFDVDSVCITSVALKYFLFVKRIILSYSISKCRPYLVHTSNCIFSA
ncbi:putative abortive infection phage resistance protein (fragment) [Candidatus Desulfosporosinus infrequens]|uniref:Putative abortive infection phage resistance protein n=1 Tax=Candidatus Desulfosporosinus infrequens TaxID=2043169 RepID=A0A2U3KMK0_9FIRM